MARKRRSKSIAFDRASIVGGTLAVVAASLAFWLDAANPAGAQGSQQAPWCAFQGSASGAFDCSYYSFEQCMATARGLGGICARNPRVVVEPVPPPRRVPRY
jgi:hypothetical protein